MNKKLKSALSALLAFLFTLVSITPAYAQTMKHKETPNYKVAFYAFDCYHMQDETGRKSGYGYEMMQGISKFVQCTFSYVGYDKTAEECIDMLRDGKVDVYTAAKRTPEREKDFVFSSHPAITSYTCMNVKVGNYKIKSGDYSTYNGITVGLLRRHTYNDKFIAFAREKGFKCKIKYYETPTELTEALISNEVDALVNSYIGIPDDEQIIENFGETPYYIMARKEDKALIKDIDNAIDQMNMEKPSWRTTTYNKYYGSIAFNSVLTAEESAYLKKLQDKKIVIRAAIKPDRAPYSWFDDNDAKGITVDIFKETAKKLNLKYEIVSLTKAQSKNTSDAYDDIDIIINSDGYTDTELNNRFKDTDPYLSSTMSMLHTGSVSSHIDTVTTHSKSIAFSEIKQNALPEAKTVYADSVSQCRRNLLDDKADGALMMSYTAQRLANEDPLNRFHADIVPGAEIDLVMSLNSKNDYLFYGIWNKTLTTVSDEMGAKIVQEYLNEANTPTGIKYFHDHPAYVVLTLVLLFIAIAALLLYYQSLVNRRKQEQISSELAVALQKANEATKLKEDFFSKMSHDIRTPLNVVLGMTQIAKNYVNDTKQLNHALDSISSEGNYLLTLINSILDVNQLEHGTVDLIDEPFNLAECVKESSQILLPLVNDKSQTLTLDCSEGDYNVIGDEKRMRQIIINLISNAIKYTGSHGRIKLVLQKLPDNVYRFICRDNGIGMSEEFIQHICDDYARAEDSRVSKIQGTGLGMSVVKGFTELMGGTLSISSELGKGSEFTVDIPFEKASEEQKELIEQIAENDEAIYETFKGKKVLLVEDNALNGEIAIELLQTMGMTVQWAENGKIGIEMFEASEEGEYFAVFMDLQMPVMNGIEASKAIRACNRSDNQIPIFAMTANTFSSDRINCQKAGMNGYIPKPVGVKEIYDTMQGIVNKL